MLLGSRRGSGNRPESTAFRIGGGMLGAGPTPSPANAFYQAIRNMYIHAIKGNEADR